MPIISAVDSCKQSESSLQVNECLQLIEREIEQTQIVKDLCAVHGRAFCETAVYCSTGASPDRFSKCLTQARETVEAEHDRAVAWGLAVAIGLAAVSLFWWRRPVGRALRRLSRRLGQAGAK